VKSDENVTDTIFLLYLLLSDMTLTVPQEDSLVLPISKIVPPTLVGRVSPDLATFGIKKPKPAEGYTDLIMGKVTGLS
jgi:hypothetical protein